MHRFRLVLCSPGFRQFLVHLGLASLFGFAWYLLLYNRFPLYLSHVNYIYSAGGDALMHQLGWEWFRQEPWAFPLGKITGYGYPFGTSIAYTDAIPLFAIPLKLLSPLFEPEFQFYGLWELASLVGQMLLGFLILNEFTRSYPFKALGASLLVLSPPLLFRAFYHNSLSAHWILLAAIWFVILEYRGKMRRWGWMVLFALAVWIHMYYIPMLFPLWLIGMLFRYQRAGRRWGLAMDALGVVAATFLAAFILGYFELGAGSLSAYGFGVWSWNLNGFFNPMSFGSAYIKEMATGTGGQYEGFSYLGLGNLLILPVALYLFLAKETSPHRLSFGWPFLTATVIYLLFALSNTAYFNDHLLWDIPLSDRLMQLANLFRSSGRFSWPVFYFLVLFGMISLVRHIRFPVPVLALVVLLQFSDLQPLIQTKHQAGFAGYQSSLQADFWQAAAGTNQHLVIVPARKLFHEYEPFAIYAVHNHLTLNLGFFARSDTEAFAAYALQVWDELQANQPDAQTIYVLTDEAWIALARDELADDLFVCEVDGFTVLLSRENGLVSSGINLSQYCPGQSE
jgi:hypothetical protein